MPIVRLAAASLIAAMYVAGAPGASAADLGDDYQSRYGAAYDDPRYADIYRDPAPPPPRRYEQYEEEEYYREDYGPRRLAEVPPPYVRDRACLPRREIRHRLHDEGWTDFHDIEFRDETALVRARRPSGELYELRVDRCSGDIVHAQPLHGPVWGPYAYGSPRRVWQRY